MATAAVSRCRILTGPPSPGISKLKDPVTAKGKPLFFRGIRNLDATLDYAFAQLRLKSASIIGFSFGAAFVDYDHDMLWISATANDSRTVNPSARMATL
jgi:hypothetical protein